MKIFIKSLLLLSLASNIYCMKGKKPRKDTTAHKVESEYGIIKILDIALLELQAEDTIAFADAHHNEVQKWRDRCSKRMGTINKQIHLSAFAQEEQKESLYRIALKENKQLTKEKDSVQVTCNKEYRMLYNEHRKKEEQIEKGGKKIFEQTVLQHLQDLISKEPLAALWLILKIKGKSDDSRSLMGCSPISILKELDWINDKDEINSEIKKLVFRLDQEIGMEKLLSDAVASLVAEKITPCGIKE